MKITDRIRKAFAKSTPEDIDSRIAAKQAEIRETREQLDEAKEGRLEAEITGTGDSEKLDREVLRLEAKLARLPDQLDQLLDLRREAELASMQREADRRVEELQKRYEALRKPYEQMLSAIEAWNSAVAEAGDLGQTHLAPGDYELRVGKEVGKAHLAASPYHGGIPSLDAVRDDAIGQITRHARTAIGFKRSHSKREQARVSGGSADELNRIAAEDRKREALMRKAKAGDIDARSELALLDG